MEEFVTGERRQLGSAGHWSAALVLSVGVCEPIRRSGGGVRVQIYWARAVQSQGSGAAQRSTAGPSPDGCREWKSISRSPGMGNNKPDLPALFIGSHHHPIPSQRKPPEVLAPLSPPHSQTAKDRLRHLHHQPGRTFARACFQRNITPRSLNVEFICCAFRGELDCTFKCLINTKSKS